MGTSIKKRVFGHPKKNRRNWIKRNRIIQKNIEILKSIHNDDKMS
jgi:hypothetical protein